MEFKLTSFFQYSHHDKDGCDRNYLSFYLNDVLILKQKIPFDTNHERGFDRPTTIYDSYLLNGKIHQKRKKFDKDEIREVSYPVSKKALEQFAIPKDFILYAS